MKPQNDRQMYLICFGNEIPRKSVFFLPVSRHQSSRNIIDSLRIFNQQSSTGHVESEYISSNQSTVSLFWQEYCNKKRKHCVLGQRAPNLATRVTRSQRQSYVFEDDSSIIIFVSYHQFHKISSGRCPLLIFHVRRNYIVTTDRLAGLFTCEKFWCCASSAQLRSLPKTNHRRPFGEWRKVLET